jgi:hypothetical protein
MAATLDLPGVSVIETPAEARSHARGWNRMASQIDTPDAPDEAKAKARELRQRSQAAQAWARQQEDALSAGKRAHDEEAAKVTPIRQGTAQEQHGDLVRASAGPSGREGFASGAARAAGHKAYQTARPQAMRVGRHVFQGAQEPFGPIGDSWDLLWEAIGVTIGVIILTDLLRAPRAIVDVSQHSLAGLNRLVGLTDPLSGLAPAHAAGSTRTPAPGSTVLPAGKGAGGFLPAGASYKPGRTDQGQDGQTDPGGPIIAPGAGYVVSIKSNPGGFGPSYPVVHFTSGPYSGQTLYLGHTLSALKAGARFVAGAVLSHTGLSPVGNASVPGWFEIGYAPGGVPGPFGQPVPF